MVDPVGVALNLPSTFIACIETFQRIQYSRHFEEDRENLLLRLELVGLALARCGKSIGILDENFCIEEHGSVEECKIYLNNILKRFKKAQQKIHDLESRNDPIRQSKESNDLLMKMKTWQRDYTLQLSIKYTNVISKVKWAIYDKKELEECVSNLRVDVYTLTETFPALQRPLQEKEVKDLDNKALMLMRVIASQMKDKDMEDIANQEIETRKLSIHLYENMEVNGTSDLQLLGGDTVENGAKRDGKGHKYSGIRIQGGGKVNFGDQWR